MINTILLAKPRTSWTAINSDINQRSQDNVDSKKFDNRKDIVNLMYNIDFVITLKQCHSFPNKQCIRVRYNE